VLAIEAKKHFQQTLLSPLLANEAMAAAEEWDEALATGLTSVSEWAAEWQSLLLLPWQWQ